MAEIIASRFPIRKTFTPRIVSTASDADASAADARMLAALRVAAEQVAIQMVRLFGPEIAEREMSDALVVAKKIVRAE
jgi:hypothetical protein